MTQSSARERIERFAQAFRDGDIDSALALIDALIDEHPEQAPLHWHRARTLKAMQRDADALDAVKRLIELKPDYAPAWLMRAELSANDSDGNYPESDLRRALELDPQLARAHLLLAQLLANGDRRAQAQSALARALELDPNQPEAYALRGQWRRHEAMAGFGDEGPLDEDIIQTFSGQRYSRSKLGDARADFECALSLRNDPRVRLRLADVLHDLGEHDAALAAYDAVLSVTPTDDPRRDIIEELRARSLDGGRGERERMARLLESALAGADASERASVGHDIASSMVKSAAAGMRSGMSLQQALAQFVSDHPDDALAIDIAWKIYALAHEPEPDYAVSPLARYPKFMREHAERVASALCAQGFRVIGDYEPLHLAEQLGKPTLVRIYAAGDGITCGASYRIEPKWPGWIAFLLLKLTGKWQRPAVVELETAFDDGGFLITNNAGTTSPFAYRGKVDLVALVAETPPAVVHARHRERIERYRREHPHATAQRVDTEERVMAMQARINTAKGEFRRSIGYVEENELRQLLGTHYERLALRVREKLQQIVAAAG
ncbi:MAG TPA: tetratricopeptide repeat protein [Xanthomonadales bacterium]|nr:tetratricopeptide repeat protein [Xanthomonadales bacterium]